MPFSEIFDRNWKLFDLKYPIKTQVKDNGIIDRSTKSKKSTFWKIRLNFVKTKEIIKDKLETTKTIKKEVLRFLVPKTELFCLTITWSWPNLEKDEIKVTIEKIKKIAPELLVLKELVIINNNKKFEEMLNTLPVPTCKNFLK